MRFRKSKLFNKILIALGACVFALSCLVLPTFAYVDVQPQGDYGPVFIYGENGLNTTLVVDSFGVDTPLYDTGLLEFNYEPSIGDKSWKIQLWRDVNNSHTFISELAVGSSATSIMNTAVIFTNVSLSDLLNNYNNYYLRFALNNSPQNYYVEYSLNNVFNYYDEFMLSSESYEFFYLVYQVTDNSLYTTTFDNLGVYFGSHPSLRFEYNGKFFNNFDQTMINTESYNAGVQSQQSIINDLRNQNNSLNSQVNSLISQLQVAQDTQARTLFWTIATTPFESFKTIWDVNVWGLNIGGIIIGGLMALLIVYLIKKVWK